jgi:hypothetical protein
LRPIALMLFSVGFAYNLLDNTGSIINATKHIFDWTVTLIHEDEDR